MSHTHILIQIDNTSAVAAVNKMGSTKSLDNDKVACQIWEWAIHQGVWLTATHIPGILNEAADAESRKAEARTEWMLNKNDFKLIILQLQFTPILDLFASRLNAQLPSFVSYRPDPNSQAVNAFTLDWSNV